MYRGSPFGFEKEGGEIVYNGNESRYDVLDDTAPRTAVQWKEADYRATLQQDARSHSNSLAPALGTLERSLDACNP